MKNKDRVIGLDILRFLSMIGIIGLHIMNQGGIINNLNINSINYIIYLILLTIFFTSVNIFGLLSGYLNINKTTIKYKRLIELIIIVIFWSFVITFTFYKFNLYGFKNFGLKELALGLFPSIAGNYWYITSYILVFLMIPYINIFFNSLNQKKSKKFLIILFILFCIIQNVLGHVDLFKICYGYSPFWLIYLYMIGGYIKKYNIDINKKKNTLLLITSVLVTSILNYVFKIIGIKFLGHIVKADFLIDYISPLTLLSSILMLILFKNFNNKKLSKIFVYLSNMSFSVYIIHCHRVIFYYALKDFFIFLINENIFKSILLIILSLFLIYFVCCILDELRKILFKLFKINKFIEFIGNKLDLLLNL